MRLGRCLWRLRKCTSKSLAAAVQAAAVAAVLPPPCDAVGALAAVAVKLRLGTLRLILARRALRRFLLRLRPLWLVLRAALRLMAQAELSATIPASARIFTGTAAVAGPRAPTLLRAVRAAVAVAEVPWAPRLHPRRVLLAALRFWRARPIPPLPRTLAREARTQRLLVLRALALISAAALAAEAARTARLLAVRAAARSSLLRAVAAVAVSARATPLALVALAAFLAGRLLALAAVQLQPRSTPAPLRRLVRQVRVCLAAAEALVVRVITQARARLVALEAPLVGAVGAVAVVRLSAVRVAQAALGA